MKWPRNRRCRRDENPQLLRDVRDGFGGARDREAGRGHEDPDQRDIHEAHPEGRGLQVRVTRHARCQGICRYSVLNF